MMKRAGGRGNCRRGGPTAAQGIFMLLMSLLDSYKRVCAPQNYRISKRFYRLLNNGSKNIF
jgi:hypothetical protein